MERQITISIEEYNKLIDMHTKREELPERIEGGDGYDFQPLRF
mgnify:CR=1 FL=1